MDIYKADVNYSMKMDAYSLDSMNYRELLEDLEENCPVVINEKQKMKEEHEVDIANFWEEEMAMRRKYYNEHKFEWSPEQRQQKILTAIPHFDDTEAAVNSIQDDFVDVLEDIENKLPASELKQRYNKAIKELRETEQFTDYVDIDYGSLDYLWADKHDSVWNMPYLKTELSCDYLANLDWRLIIMYAPYLIKRFGFSKWYYSFRVNKNLPDEAKENINKLHLDKRGKKILLQLIDYAKFFKTPELAYAPVAIYLNGFCEWLEGIDKGCIEESKERADKLLLTDEQKKVLLDSKSWFNDGRYLEVVFKDGTHSAYEVGDI